MLNELSNKVFWINSRNRADRFMQMSKRLQKEQIVSERFEALQGGFVPNPDVNFSRTIEHIGRHLNNGEKGCYLSHRELWKKQLKNGWKKVLILEDDCIFLPNYKEVLKKIDFDFDLLFLGQYDYSGNGKGEFSALIDIGKKPIYKTVGSWLTHAYIIDISICQALLDYTVNGHTSIDGMIAEFCPKVNAYAIAPAVAIQDVKSKSSLR
jgi:glycosyl transferase family 25